jgi:esterase/lipase
MCEFSLNLRQEIFGDDIVIATVKNFPIIGTNMSSVEALVALIEEDFEKALSKILDMLPFKPNEETLSYINDYIKEYSKELKTNLRELRNNLGEFIAQLLGIQSTPIIKRCVKNIVQELNGTISQTMSDEKNKEKKSKKKSDHVINNDVLKV